MKTITKTYTCDNCGNEYIYTVGFYGEVDEAINALPIAPDGWCVVSNPTYKGHRFVCDECDDGDRQKRKEGYYWVRVHDCEEEEVGWWDGKLWWLYGMRTGVVDGFLAVIDENRITR